MSSTDARGTPPQPSIQSFSALFDRVLESEQSDLMRCMAADLNAFLMSLSLLSGRKEVNASDVKMLFERFRLTLRAAPPSARGQSEFAPQRHGTHDRAGEHGVDAVSRSLEQR